MRATVQPPLYKTSSQSFRLAYPRLSMMSVVAAIDNVAAPPPVLPPQSFIPSPAVTDIINRPHTFVDESQAVALVESRRRNAAAVTAERRQRETIRREVIAADISTQQDSGKEQAAASKKRPNSVAEAVPSNKHSHLTSPAPADANVKQFQSVTREPSAALSRELIDLVNGDVNAAIEQFFMSEQSAARAIGAIKGRSTVRLSFAFADGNNITHDFALSSTVWDAVAYLCSIRTELAHSALTMTADNGTNITESDFDRTLQQCGIHSAQTLRVRAT